MKSYISLYLLKECREYIADDLLAGPRRSFDWDFDDIEFSSGEEQSYNNDNNDDDDDIDDDDDDDPAWKPSMVNIISLNT